MRHYTAAWTVIGAATLVVEIVALADRARNGPATLSEHIDALRSTRARRAVTDGLLGWILWHWTLDVGGTAVDDLAVAGICATIGALRRR